VEEEHACRAARRRAAARFFVMGPGAMEPPNGLELSRPVSASTLHYTRFAEAGPALEFALGEVEEVPASW
jgi:hypothetical protein